METSLRHVNLEIKRLNFKKKNETKNHVLAFFFSRGVNVPFSPSNILEIFITRWKKIHEVGKGKRRRGEEKERLNSQNLP